MQRLLCFVICILTLLSTLVACDKTCEHEFSEGECKKCGELCVHEFSDGECKNCGELCVHEFSDGICSICGEKCIHEFENSVCTFCQSVCSHSYVKGMCEICKDVNLTAKDLEKRKFKYSYFELSWSKTATDAQKEGLRKIFNTDNDTELFDKMYDDYRQVMVSFGSFMVSGYKFQTVYANPPKMYAYPSKDGKYLEGIECSVKDNVIKIGKEKFYYEGDKIYSIGDSEDYKGISIKLVFTEG